MSRLDPLFLGLDIGTSGVRTAVVDAAGAVVSEARARLERRPHPSGEGEDAEAWWEAAHACLAAQMGTLREPGRLAALAIDGTSGTMVLTDADGDPVGPALRYDTSGFAAEADLIARHAPEGSIARGAGSATARALRLCAISRAPRHLVHEADFILARLSARPGRSDDANALKTGWDPQACCWPGWMAGLEPLQGLLPQVFPVGARLGPIAPGQADRLNMPRAVECIAGATDSVAAFLAAGAPRAGLAVTSLGSTLALKIVSDVRVEGQAEGVYSHRVGGLWLAGGASNTGGAVLLQHFSLGEIARLSTHIDPCVGTGLDYMPLPRPGERFPVSDPDLLPRLTPRPAEDALFLAGMLEGIARVEAAGYRALSRLGAPYPERVLTAGGGAGNTVWSAIRARMLGCPVAPLPEAEASVGMARLAARAMR